MSLPPASRLAPALALALLIGMVPATWQGGDAYTYLNDAALLEAWVHPHHLVYHGILALGSPLGHDGVRLVGQLHAALVAGLGVFFVGQALDRRGVPSSTAAALLWALVACRGPLADLGAFTPYAGLFAGAALAAWGMAARSPWLTAVGCVVAFLYHQTGVLLLVPAGVALGRRSAPLGVALLVMIAAQTGAWWLRDPARGLLGWTLGFALSDNPTWGGQLHRAPVVLLSLSRQVLWLGHGWLQALAVLPFGLGVGVLVASRRRPAAAAPWLAWLALHLGFFAWWMPEWRWFLTPLLIPVVLWAGEVRPPPRLVAGLAVVLALWNLPTAWWTTVTAISPEAARADALAAYEGPCMPLARRWTYEALRARHGIDGVMQPAEGVCHVVHDDERDLLPDGMDGRAHGDLPLHVSEGVSARP